MTTSAKDIRLAAIPSTVARDFIRRHHYSGKVANNSQIGVGVFLGKTLHGVMQLGPPLDRSKLIGLVRGTEWNGFLELNRMAFDDVLPRNSESRALSILFRMLRKTRPDIEWIVSFADATQCGDGTIYRASGFVLSGLRRSDELVRTPTGEVVHAMTLKSNPSRPIPWLGGRSFVEVTGGPISWDTFVKRSGCTVVPGFQVRYLKPLAPNLESRFTFTPMPFSALDEAGARMYLGRASVPAEPTGTT